MPVSYPVSGGPGLTRFPYCLWCGMLVTARNWIARERKMMDPWNAWPGFLQEILHSLAVHWGLGVGLSIIILTVAVRVTLMPLTWMLAYRGAVHQSKLAKLEPALKAIRDRYAKDRRTQMQKTLELYRQHGLTVADGKGILGALVQMPVIYGLYKALSNGVGTTAFLWIRNLGRPDALLACLMRENGSVVGMKARRRSFSDKIGAPARAMTTVWTEQV
jgi:YidC/Oxa1 family membrane protein insertase